MAARGLDNRQIATLSTGEWIRRSQNLLITGATGSGKTWLACALAPYKVGVQLLPPRTVHVRVEIVFTIAGIRTRAIICSTQRLVVVPQSEFRELAFAGQSL